MSELAGHTIHKDHIHHGWNNAFAPCLTIAPGETVQFETVDASSGQLSRTSTSADLERLDLAASTRSPARSTSTARSRATR